MSCSKCEYCPKTYDEYCISKSNPSVYCPDAFTDRSYLCGNYWKEETSSESEELNEAAYKVH